MKRKKLANDADGLDEPKLKKTRCAKFAPIVILEKEQNQASSMSVLRLSTPINNSESDQESLAPDGSLKEVDSDTGSEEGHDYSGGQHGVKDSNMTPVRSLRKQQINTSSPSQGLLRNKLFLNHHKTHELVTFSHTSSIERNVNRSARRKSARTLIERTILGNVSDDDGHDDDIAEQIYNSEEEGQDELDENTKQIALDTPSKRGRPKKTNIQRRSPTPPEDLTAHETYFYQNKGGRPKTSNNTLASLELLDHEEFFSRSRRLRDQHEDDLINMELLHIDKFNQWQFELSQDFNICVYGFGSKRSLLTKFAAHIHNSQAAHTESKIVVVNGYVSSLTIRDVLKTVASAVTKDILKSGSPTDMLEVLFSLLDQEKHQEVTLIINSIDGISLRRTAHQTILSRLASHPQIHLVVSADHPLFPLLWDNSLRSTYNFLFHDCTTFQPYTAEIDVVEEVHVLLGRSGRRIGGKEGVSFVLRSLPENAKNLFRLLIAEQLIAMDDNASVTCEEGDDEDYHRKQASLSKRPIAEIEYRFFYQKAVEEFICTNEMSFRTLLKEFHDHQMIQSRKDASGTEMLSVPFRKEELEMIMEDIMC